MRTFLCASSPNFFCFGFGSTRATGEQQHTVRCAGVIWGELSKAHWRFSAFCKWRRPLKRRMWSLQEGIATGPHNTSSKEKGPILLILSWNTWNWWTLWRAGDGVLMNSNAASHLCHLVPIPYTWLRPSSAICLPCFLILVFQRDQWVLLWVAGSSSIFLWMCDPISRGKILWLTSLGNFFLLYLQ